jgi:hypothetical protein
VYQSVSGVSGALYKVSFDLVTRTAGDIRASWYGAAPAFQSAPGTYSYYRTRPASGDANIYIDGGTAFSGTVDNALILKVLTPSGGHKAGITIVNAQGGSTQNWLSDDGISGAAVSYILTATNS